MTDHPRNDMKARFKNIDDKFAVVRAEMVEEFERLDEHCTSTVDWVKTEGQKTRRHFDFVVAQFKEYVKVLADGTARNTERLDGHEKRLTVLEHPPG